jgi:hypothetical protein
MFEEDLYVMIRTIHLSDAAELMLSSNQCPSIAVTWKDGG